MNIALTGSSGLIGSKLVNDLERLGHSILCISSTFSSHKDNIYLYEELVSNSIDFKADYLIHLASINSNLSESEVSLETSLMNDAIKYMKLLNCKKFIFFSTSKVYGDNSFKFQNFSEKSDVSPKCFYGKAKAKCEEILIKESTDNYFDYLIFRPAPLLIDDPKSSLGKLLLISQKSPFIPSFKIGNQNIRSFLSYDLLKCVIEHSLNNFTKVKNQIFNLANSSDVSLNDLLRDFGLIKKKKVRFFYLPDFVFKSMLRVNRLQLILCRLFGNFSISNAKLKEKFELPNNF